MREKLKALYELQQVDLESAKTQKAKASLDDGSSKKLQVESARQQAERADKEYHQDNTELRDKELNLKSVEDKQKSFKDKLYGGRVSNPKELESMEQEIEMLGRQKGKLEERILELLDIVEERKSALAAAQAALKQREDEHVAIVEKTKRDNVALAAKIQELGTKRVSAASAIDPVLLKRYESMRAHAAGVVVSKLEDGHCSACHTQQMPGVVRDVAAGLQITTCENCGRILYLEE